MVNRIQKSRNPKCAAKPYTPSPVKQPDANNRPSRLRQACPALGSEFDQLLDASQDAIRIINKDFSLRRINRTFAEMTGVNQDEITGKKCWEIFPSPHCHSSECRLQQIISGTDTIEVEIVRKRKDGTAIPCRVTAFPLFDAAGELTCITEIFRDITAFRRMEEQVEESEERYRALVDLGTESGEAIVMLQDSMDGDGIQVFVNDYWPRITGYSKNELLGTSFFNLVVSADRQSAIDKHSQKMLGGKGAPGILEVHIINKDGHEVPLEITGASTHYQGQYVDVLYIRDITQLKKLESTFSDSRTRYAYLFETAPVCGLDLDFSQVKLYLDEIHQQGITDLQCYFNQHPDAILECSRLAKVISMNKAYRDLFKAQDTALFSQYFPEPLKDSRLNRKAIGDDYARLYRGVTLFAKEESVHNLKRQIKRVVTSIFIPPGYENNWSRLLMSLFDITELKQKEKRLTLSESRLRLLSKRNLTVHEDVRAKLSRELHDQIGQELVILRRKAQSLLEESRKMSLRQKAGELIILSDKLMDSVHNLSVELRPMMLDELGLEKAIQWYAEDFERRTGICCVFNSHLECVSDIFIGEDISISAYRIFQEAMTNILRHSKAQTAKIDVSVRNCKLIISVKDNGIGYNLEELHDKTSLGLLGMKERASMVDGYVKLDGNQGKGARVVACFPLEQSKVIRGAE
jgi:PAS domain S-box-containing protein